MNSNLLKAERIRRGWTQTRVAQAVGVDAKTVGRWERGITAPYPYFREQLCFLFEKTPEQLGLLSDDESSLLEHAAFLSIQSLAPERVTPSSFLADPSIPQPLESATSLVGGQDVLIEAKERLLAGHNVALRAVDGLPGIGKTTLAAVLTMDQQVRDSFQDGILWAGLGMHPNVLGHLARWGTLLGVMPSQVENIGSRAAWSRALRAAIGTRRLLLVISDAWTAEDALSLQIGGMACAHLVTTSFSEVAYAFDQKGGMTIPQLEQTERIALLRHFIPELVEQDLQGADMLVEAVGGLPLALTLMGSYLASQTFPAQLHPLHIALIRFYDTEARLRARMPSPSEELEGSMPLSLHTVIAMCDQQLSPQAHASLHALTVFPPKPESFSQEAALAVTQQPVETLDALCNAGLLEIWGPGRYLLHQAVADYLSAQGKVSTAQEQYSILIEGDVQNAPTPNSHHLGPRPARQDLRLQIHSVRSNVSTFRPFKHFSSRSLLISSVILLTVLVLIAVLLPVSNLFFLRNSAHQVHLSTVANANPYPPNTGMLALDDPLSSNSKGYNWSEVHDSNGSCTFVEGTYHAKTLAGGYYYPCFAKNTDFSNFSYEVQMKIIRGDCGAILFRANSINSTFYYFRVCQDGSYALYLYTSSTGNNTCILIAPKTNLAIHPGLNQTNLVAVVAHGSTFYLYMNHQKIDSISDSTYSHGQIAVVADGFPGNDPTKVVYNNAKVWKA